MEETRYVTHEGWPPADAGLQQGEQITTKDQTGDWENRKETETTRRGYKLFYVAQKTENCGIELGMVELCWIEYHKEKFRIELLLRMEPVSGESSISSNVISRPLNVRNAASLRNHVDSHWLGTGNGIPDHRDQ